jgi:hypothetical protein
VHGNGDAEAGRAEANTDEVILGVDAGVRGSCEVRGGSGVVRDVVSLRGARALVAVDWCGCGC